MPTHCVDILIPSFDNPQFLGPCINSILGHTQSRENIRIIVINNGAKETENYVTKHPLVKFIHAGKNLGWEGGLKLGLEHSDTEFVCFMNDDTYIPYASSLWVNRCLSEFANPEVAAVGPTTNLCRGYQNIFLDQFAGYYAPYASLLIFFCVFLRRKDLDAVGGVDDTLPGGDDLDLCIRLTKAGKKLVICRDAFVFHHGFKTGERVKGGPDRPVGWNSREMTENTNKALIRKHGFRTFLDCNHGGLTNPEDRLQPSRKNEAAVVMKHIIGEKIYELGCGAAKTTPTAIGIDRVKLGDVIPNLEGAISVADIQADVTHELPIPDESADTIVTRHILEHCVDTIGTLRNWIKKIKPGKRLILTVPDETACLTIPMNPEHRHAFTPDSLKTIVELLGMKQVAMENGYNGVSLHPSLIKAESYRVQLNTFGPFDIPKKDKWVIVGSGPTAGLVQEFARDFKNVGIITLNAELPGIKPYSTIHIVGHYEYYLQCIHDLDKAEVVFIADPLHVGFRCVPVQVVNLFDLNYFETEFPWKIRFFEKEPDKAKLATRNHTLYCENTIASAALNLLARNGVKEVHHCGIDGHEMSLEYGRAKMFENAYRIRDQNGRVGVEKRYEIEKENFKAFATDCGIDLFPLTELYAQTR